jgi:hypothetical protein
MKVKVTMLAVLVAVAGASSGLWAQPKQTEKKKPAEKAQKPVAEDNKKRAAPIDRSKASSNSIKKTLREAIATKTAIVVKDTDGALFALATRNVELLENQTLRVPKGSKVMSVDKEKVAAGDPAFIAKNLLVWLKMIPANEEGTTKEILIKVAEVIATE